MKKTNVKLKNNIRKDELLAAANRVREIRLGRGNSQEKFAEYLDISLSAYKKIESSENGISVNILRKLHRKFNISTDYILYGECKEFSDVLFLIDNCSETDKMKILFQLLHYFVNDKNKTFIKR